METDSAANGKQARKRVRRTSHAGWGPAPGRPDPVAILEQQTVDRVPELVPLRHARMAASPFTFYRGAAAIMAADLADSPVTGDWVQACGDAHLSNFGMFAGPDRVLVADVNDFDETLPAPWEWDLKRLTASVEIAARDRGFRRREAAAAVKAAARNYRETVRHLATQTHLDVWYVRIDVADIRAMLEAGATGEELRTFQRTVDRAQRKTRMKALEKLTEVVDGEIRIRHDPPVLVPLDRMYEGGELAQAEQRIAEVLAHYRETLPDDRRVLFDRYDYVQAAHKVVGVGSVGTRAWVALFVGRGRNDPLFLQIKQAQASVLEPYAKPSSYAHHGQRVVQGQLVTQAASDVMLGWLSGVGPDSKERHFYVRQLWDQKGSAVIERMSPDGLARYAALCGAILGRAHARTGDAVAIGSYLGRADTMDRAMVEFASRYADQNERDFAAFEAAIADGRLRT
jgi:uncharacterized protein (DUF2252 family)